MRPKSGARRASVLVSLLVVGPILASCSSNTTVWVNADDSAPWPGTYGNSRNASYADRNPAPTLVPAWNRPLQGANLSQPAISTRGMISATANTEAGCTTFNLELTVGRKVYCRRDEGDPALRAPVVDNFENTYIGVPGWLLSINAQNQVRWRVPVAGTPMWIKLAGDNSVFAVSHIGQVVLVDAQSGRATAPRYGLFPDISSDNNGAGLQDCPRGGEGCPIAGPPALDTAAERAFVVVSNAFNSSKVVAIDYGKIDGKHDLRQAWERKDITEGVVGAPALSADGSTVYVNMRSKKLMALNAKTGETKWTHELGYESAVPPSVSPDGIIISAAPGLERTNFVALHDDGDRASEVFKRVDMAMVSPVTQIRGVGYVIGRSWAGVRPQLIEFNASTGETLRSFDLPDVVKASSGVSVGPEGELVTVGDNGQVFAFTSGRRIGDSVDQDG